MNRKSNDYQSFRELQVEIAQGWLKDDEAYWTSPDMDDDIIDFQKDLDDMCCGKYTKHEIFEEMQLHADTSVRMFADLKSVDIKNAGDFGEFLSVLQRSKLYERFRDAIEARISLTGLPYGDKTVDRLISIAPNVLTILSANRVERISHALQEFIKTYALGCDAAGIMLCRTALELTLKHRIPYGMLERHLGHRRSPYEISDRIAIAYKTGLLNDRTKKLADNIRMSANQISHEDTQLTEKTHVLVQNALDVIEVLLTKHDPVQAGEDLSNDALKRMEEYKKKIDELFKKEEE
jgi:hypothetical protein